MSHERILIVDDEKLIRWSIADRLKKEGYDIAEAATAEEGLAALAGGEFDLLLLDYRLPDRDGLEVLNHVSKEHGDLPVVMMTAYSTVDSAVAAIKLGAYDYLNKPFDLEEIVFVIRRALEATSLRHEVRELRVKLRDAYGVTHLIGRSSRMREVFDMIAKIAASNATTILLQGESGTGKGMVARAIHQQSRRADKPFMTVTCTALPENLLESELFGHEKGSFTDARMQKKGLFQLADGGTVFLDEIGDISLPLQAKLLRFLEEKAFKRVGGSLDITVDVRIIATTNHDLEQAVRSGRFRADLFYRLNVIPITLPPLRERKEDIPLLAASFMVDFNREFNRNVQRIADDALDLLKVHDWPGNVRELRNMVERALLLGAEDELCPPDLPLELRRPPGPHTSTPFVLPPQGIRLADVERDLVVQALERANGNQTQAAKLLGLNRDQIRYRIEKFSLKETPS